MVTATGKPLVFKFCFLTLTAFVTATLVVWVFIDRRTSITIHRRIITINDYSPSIPDFSTLSTEPHMALLTTDPQAKDSKLSTTKYLDEKRHTDFNLYKTVTEPNKPCTNDTYLLIAVITSPKSMYHRDTYRSTVLSPVTSGNLSEVRYVFLLGTTDDNDINSKILSEAQKHKDIVVGNFPDSYENLSLKSMFLTYWASSRCPNTKYIHKLDDDVFADIASILKYLKSLKYDNNRVLGCVFKHVKPIRDERNKWHANTYYQSEEYPTYVSGPSYILSTPLLMPLFKAAMTLPLLRLEDAFITGLSAKATNLSIEYVDVPGFTYNAVWRTGTNLKNIKTVHGVNTNQIKAMWVILSSQ